MPIASNRPFPRIVESGQGRDSHPDVPRQIVTIDPVRGDYAEQVLASLNHERIALLIAIRAENDGSRAARGIPIPDRRVVWEPRKREEFRRWAKRAAARLERIGR